MTFTFIDLFSGIGGFHLGCVKNGGKCLAACDIDPIAREIYNMNYGIIPHDDIKTIKPIKNIDLLCSGFPCQPVSLLGIRKGANDERGLKLFKYLLKYIKNTQPKVFLLENVRGLLSSNNGEYFTYILKSLKNLGYNVSYEILNSKNFGVPQFRERIYIVGHLEKPFDFTKLLNFNNTVPISKILESKPSSNLHSDRFDNVNINKKIKYKSGFILRAKLSPYTHMKLFSTNGIVGTLATASPPVIYDEHSKIVRHLSKKELLKLQGFSSDFKFPKDFSRTNYVHYLGNAVTVNVINTIVKELIAQKLIT